MRDELALLVVLAIAAYLRQKKRESSQGDNRGDNDQQDPVGH